MIKDYVRQAEGLGNLLESKFPQLTTARRAEADTRGDLEKAKANFERAEDDLVALQQLLAYKISNSPTFAEDRLDPRGGEATDKEWGQMVLETIMKEEDEYIQQLSVVYSTQQELVDVQIANYEAQIEVANAADSIAVTKTKAILLAALVNLMSNVTGD